MFSLLGWIIVGGLAGWIASKFMSTDREMGLVSNIVVGMIGSLVGGALVVLLQSGTFDLLNTSFNDLNVVSLLVSVLGAVVFLGILKVLRR